MRRRYDRRRVGAAAKAAAAGDASSASSQTTTAGDAAVAPSRRLSSQMKLHVHGPEFQNGDELVLNPEFFPMLKDLPADKYVVEIFHATDSERLREETAVAAATPFSDADCLRAHNHLLLDVPPSNATPPKGKWQVSVFKDTAAAFQLAAFNDATVRFVEKHRVELDFVEISLKDQFLSRRDLWYLKQSLVGMALYVGKNVRVQGTRWQVMDLRVRGESVRSGVISKTTKFAFRSRTSRVMWLAQMSPEMWDMANSGKLYMEIFLQLVQNVLNKWIKHKVSHSLTIMLFARSYYPELDTGDRDVGYGALRTPPRTPQRHNNRSTASATATARRVLHHGPSFASRQSKVDAAADSAFPFANKSDDMWAIGVDEDGRHYQDFYKIVAFDSAVTDLQPLLVQLKEEMNGFPHLCGWRSPRAVASPMRTGLPGDHEKPPGSFAERRQGVPSNARDGNLLEAVNLVLNIFEKHHIDRHLARSGQSVVLITAGNGIFRVKQRLAEITEQRMMDHGIGIDMISLSTPPLHKCPLFLFKQTEMSELTLPTRVDGMEPIGHDVCTCGSMQTQAPPPTTSTVRASATAHLRSSRAGSNDHAENQEALLDHSVRGGVLHTTQQQQQPPPSSSQGGVCKHCLARNATRKRYEVPLWIPLSFVQERMMIEHKCPLDADITTSCSICCPFGLGKKAKMGFEPLPMCRMFTDVATWQEPPRNSRPTHSNLPKPLERLLNHFQDTNASPAAKPGDDGTGDDIDYLQSRTFSSDFSLLLDNDYLSLGRDSELVRARAPSLTSLDDEDMMTFDGGATVELPKFRSFSPVDVQKFRREFENYDDAVFNAPLTKKASKYSMKNGAGGDEDSQVGGTNRMMLTPPMRPNGGNGGVGGGLYQAPLSTKKSSARMTLSTSQYHQSALTSTGGDDTPAPPNRWRSPPPPNMNMLTTSPGPLNRMSEGKMRMTAATAAVMADANSGDGSTPNEGDDTSSPDISLTRGRTLGGSLPNTFQLLAAGDGGTYANSPILLPLGDNSTKDPLFHSHAYIYKQLTSNQRRWSQVRASDGKNPYKLVQSVLKWKSLCCPALLPLTTDFVPGSEELKKHYSESFYSVTLPERDEQSGVTFRDYRELVMEMVAQRFSQDFQLVTVEATKTSSNSNSVLFRLTMGHRIHEIKYNEETQTVDVKRYLQRASARSDVDIMEYRYSLYSPVADRFLFASQEFRKYPRHEYQWNYLDQLICGYYDDMNDAIRYKRILYCIMPPQLTGDVLVDEPALKLFTDRCRKFIDSLKSKAADVTSFPTIKISSEWRNGIHRSGAAAFKHVNRENVRMVLHASDSPSSQNWLVTRLDTELLASQAFHLEVQWLVCRSALVDDYIQVLVRRAKQLSLDFMQVPENGVSNDLDLHPLVCPIFLPLRDATEQRLVEATLVDHLHFCCEALHVIPRVHLNHGDEYTILDPQPPNERRRLRFYRQYVHRTLACFVRVTQTGLVWISNRKLQCREVQPVYEAIRHKVEAVRAANAALKDIVSDVHVLVEQAAAQRRDQQNQQNQQEEKTGHDVTKITVRSVEDTGTLRASEKESGSLQQQNPRGEDHVAAPKSNGVAAEPKGCASEKENHEAAACASAAESVAAVDPGRASPPAGGDKTDISLPLATASATTATSATAANAAASATTSE